MDGRRHPVAWPAILAAAASEFVVLFAMAGRYGYHRDELYFRVAARHPAWGYDDQPALTPLLGRFSEWAFGDSPRGLRVVSAIAVALVVVLVALIARELGGGRAGQAVAAFATAASGAAMAVGHLLSTTTFDLLVWVTVVLLVTRILGGGRRAPVATRGPGRWGWARKQRSRAATRCLSRGRLPSRSPLRAGPQPVALGGLGLAFVLWLPNLVWQVRHGWPQLELARQIGGEDPVGNRIGLVPLQVLLVGPLLAPLWLAGLWWLLRQPEARPYRPLGIAYLVLLAMLFLTGAKPYYTMGLLLSLLAAGGVVAERRLSLGRRGRTRLAALIGVSAVLAAAVTLPLVPVGDLHATPIPNPQSGCNRDGRLAEVRRDSGPRRKPPSSRATRACRRVCGQLRRGGRDRPLRPSTRHPPRVLRAQRLLALRAPSRRRRSHRRARLSRPSRITRNVHRVHPVRPDRQRCRDRQRGAGRACLDVPGHRRQMVVALAQAAPSERLTIQRRPPRSPSDVRSGNIP